MRVTFIDNIESQALSDVPLAILHSSCGEKQSSFLEAVVPETCDALFRALAFEGNRDQFALLSSHDRPLILQGIGSEKEASCDQLSWWIERGQALGRRLSKEKWPRITLALDACRPEEEAAYVFGVMLQTWSFRKYITKRPVHDLCDINVLTKHSGQIEDIFKAYRARFDAIAWARMLAIEPGNIIYPATFVEELRKQESLGLKCEALDKPAMEKLGMGALLGVAQGSSKAPYLAIAEWKGNPNSKEAPLVFIGKGVTFDSGGLSLKPSQSMEDMKADMSGAAVVAGLMRMLAALKVPVNAVGVMALVENMVSGDAQRPGDIVTSMSGQTIEVLNTDAEGRLILADALWYAKERFKPRAMIDIATLTGAMRVALGDQFAGLFSNDDSLSQALIDAGARVDEKLWRLPLTPAYDKKNG